VKEWCIPTADAAFVAQMEEVLDVYEQPYNADEPVLCFDETNKQLIQEVRVPTAPAPGHVAKQDFEYQRHGTRNVFMFFEPLAAWRHVQTTQQRTAQDFARAMYWLVQTVYPKARCIHLVLDNLNTHCAASLYQTFEPAQARRLLSRLRFHYTPKHGSWLNMAEIELSVLSRGPLNQRIPTPTQLNLAIWRFEAQRNKKQASVNWQFTTADARIKLRHLYPSVSA
jgi:hypothetical protein